MLTNNIVKEKEYNNLKYLEFPELTKLGVQNIYTLKELDFSKKDENKNKDKNYKLIADIFDVNTDNLIYTYQTHSNKLLLIENEKDFKKDRNNFDGMITNRDDIVLITNNADCILFTIYDSKKRILANLHSGWKGTLGRILENALESFQNRFKSNAKDINIFISPSIRSCCFEVEEDVKAMFVNEFKEIDEKEYIKRKIIENHVNKYYIDTIYLNKKMIEKYNIPSKNIYDSNICSLCNFDKVHSYRGASIENKDSRGILAVKILEG